MNPSWSFSENKEPAKPLNQAQKRKGRSSCCFFFFLFLAALLALSLYGLWRWIPGGEKSIRQAITFFTHKEMSPQPASLERCPQDLTLALNQTGVTWGDEVFLRIIKSEKELEVWMRPRGVSTSFQKVKGYPILAMSGEWGPKKREGDEQAPEGFYSTDSRALNPNSKYHLSFNVGYPNAFDRAMGYTGSFIMVHGKACSIGCFAIGDEGIEEVYGLVEEALKKGQAKVAIHIYPFIPTEGTFLWAANSPHLPFWQFLAQTWHYTEQTGLVPSIEMEGKSLYFKEGGLRYSPETTDSP